MYHVHLRKGQVGRYVLLPGDPGRAAQIGKYFDHPVEVATHREYRTIMGFLEGEAVTVTSTGIGGPSTAIAVEELHALGADTFIRVGTCGGMQQDILPGDVVIANAAIRAEGTSAEYMPLAFPAVADFQVLNALAYAAGELKFRHHIGVVHCKDSFYGQHAPERMPVGAMLCQNWKAWIQAGCLASEMESAALYIIASVLHARAGAVHVCMGNQERKKKGCLENVVEDPECAIKTAILALRHLIRQDKKYKNEKRV